MAKGSASWVLESGSKPWIIAMIKGDMISDTKLIMIKAILTEGRLSFRLLISKMMSAIMEKRIAIINENE